MAESAVSAWLKKPCLSTDDIHGCFEGKVEIIQKIYMQKYMNLLLLANKVKKFKPTVAAFKTSNIWIISSVS